MNNSLESLSMSVEKNKKEIPIELKKAFDKYLDHMKDLISGYKDSLQRGVYRQYERDKLNAKLKLAEDFLRNSRDDLSLMSSVNEFFDIKEGYDLSPGEILLALQNTGYGDIIHRLEDEAKNSSIEDILTKKKIA